MKRKSVKSLVKRAIEIQTELEKVKPLYSELDQIIQTLVEREVSEYALGPIKVRLIDNFEKKNSCFRAVAIKRYELKYGSNGEVA